MNPSSTRILFFGSPDFAVPSLDAMVAAGYLVVGVVTQPDKPAGRGGALRQPPVKVRALELALDVLQPESLRDPDARARLAALKPDILVVAAYGKILPQALLDVPARGSINVHASLLPRWRGASPITSAILAGDAETGVTIMEVVRKMDAGAAVMARVEPILPSDTTGSLEPRLARLGAELLVGTLPGWFDRTIIPLPQNDELATYCAQISRDQAQLRAAMSAVEAERAVRAFNPWPSAWVGYGAAHLPVHSAHVAAPATAAPAGALSVLSGWPAISFGDTALVLDEVQKPGSRRISGRDFLNGERNRLPESVGLA
jgi:methionyl-tRNA formyltransferase